MFLELFVLVEDPVYSIPDAGQWVDKVWNWSFHGAGELRNDSVRWLRDEMHELIADVAILKDEVDVVEWLPEKHENFSVKSDHDVLSLSSIIKKLWKM